MDPNTPARRLYLSRGSATFAFLFPKTPLRAMLTSAQIRQLPARKRFLTARSAFCVA